MRKVLQNVGLLIAVVFLTVTNSLAQNLTSSEYDKALWMTTRFYGAQRSGLHNWTVAGHKPDGVPENLRGKSFLQDADGSHDLSGGWFDCGDHVKFGQTQYYAGYMLLKAYAEFKNGFDDYYSADYAGYIAANDYTFEGNGHDPNGIPDILDEVKHATDYFIKCARNSTTFYYEVGNGNWDHAEWVTSVKMQTNPQNKGGEPRPHYKNPNGAAMASFCSATLALMSRMYRPFDPVYADKCLEHAGYASDYAKTHPGAVGAASGSFYVPNDNWKNPYAIMLAEMYWATNTQSYKNEALALTVSGNNTGDVHPNEGYTFDYLNNGELALYVLDQLGHPNAGSAFNSILENNFLNNSNYNGEGIYTKGSNWGVLRYVGNAGYLIALYNKKNNQPFNDKIYQNIEYLMGRNSSNFSFIVGLKNNGPKLPHHRNAYLRDDNPENKNSMVVADKNRQLGALVGGSRISSQYKDDVEDYVNTEVCIDYNAGIVGALGAIKSEVAAVDTSKFFGTMPDLGDDQSICGTSGVTLDANVVVDNVKTFTWFKDDVKVAGPSKTQNTFTATSAGTYKVELDSLGEWTTSSSVKVLGNLPDIDLGEDAELCIPSEIELTAGVSGNGINYQWIKDGAVLGDESSSTLVVTKAGTYELNISAAGCPDKSDEIIITSSLPETEGNTRCGPGDVTLKVLSNGGPYEWYANPTGGSPLFTGANFTTNITQTTKYYVIDAGSFEQSFGPSSTNNGLTNSSNGGEVGIKFEADAAFTIIELKTLPYVYSCNNNEQVSLSMDLKGEDGQVIGTFSATPVTCKGVQSNNPSTLYTMSFQNNPIVVPSAGIYTLEPKNGNDLLWYSNGANFSNSSYTIPEVVTITSDTRSDANNSFPAIFDIVVSTGNSCDRAAVTASVDCVTGSNNFESFSDVEIYPNPVSNTLHISANDIESVDVMNEVGMSIYSSDKGTAINMLNWDNGMYIVRVKTKTGTTVQKVIKQ